MKIRIIVLFFVFSLNIYGQKVKFNKGKALQRNYYTELAYEQLKSKLIIPVEIEGNSYRFLFDTGAPNLISHSLRDIIQTRMLSSIDVKDANDKKQPLDVVVIPLLTLGEVSFKNAPAIVNDANSNFLFECLKIDGIIGSNLLRKSIVQVDSKRKRLIISDQLDKMNLQDLNYLDMALDANQSSPYIWIDLSGAGKAREQVLFDTGAEGFYDLSFNSFKKLNELGVFSHMEKAEGFKGLGLFGVSESTVHYRVQVPAIGVLGAVFSNVISVSTPAVKSRLGADIFDYGIVTLNFKDQRFYFEPFGNKVDLHEEVWAFSPTVQDGKLVIGLVWDDDFSNQLNPGIKILKINDLITDSINICDLLVMESPLKGLDTLQILVENATGEVYELHLKKYSLQENPSQK
ncbi:retropepsin-like aspartic protease [Lutimonas sp.]|uniref:retropepsin-like aspartic protease n=1 Tax=Lutimonas sp. TaxID=1872403 RepID=UPI003D9BB3C7